MTWHGGYEAVTSVELPKPWRRPNSFGSLAPSSSFSPLTTRHRKQLIAANLDTDSRRLNQSSFVALSIGLPAEASNSSRLASNEEETNAFADVDARS